MLPFFGKDGLDLADLSTTVNLKERIKSGRPTFDSVKCEYIGASAIAQ